MTPSSPFAFDWLRTHAAERPEAPFIGTAASWMSYGDAAARMRALASELARAGVTVGDRVMIALPNGAAAVIASLAVQSLGACSVEVTHQWGVEAVQTIARRTGPRLAFIPAADAAFWSRVQGAFEQIYIVHAEAPSAQVSEMLRPARLSWLAEDFSHGACPDGKPPPMPDLSPDTTALLTCTSGSTGRHRAVIQTHRNIAANTRSICSYLGLTAKDRVMAILPLHYCYGKSLLQTHLHAGGSIFFGPRVLYPQLMVQAMAEQRCTGFAGVPLTFELLRRQVSPERLKIPSLRYVTQAGGAMRLDTTRWVRAAFAPAPLFVMYGQTEATARLSYLPPDMGDAKAGSIGKGIPGVELRVLDDGARECPQGQVGELVARGDNVTPGYFGEPEATREILHDGWLWTGDLAYRDRDGFFFIVGRTRDILKIRGRRVSAAEIEDCLRGHPNVGDAAVIGVPDEIEGESALAFVVLQGEGTVDALALRRFCHARSPHLVPKVIRFEQRLPRTASGKLAKGELRARLLDS